MRNLPKLIRQRDELNRQIEELEKLGLAKPAAAKAAPIHAACLIKPLRPNFSDM